MRYFSVMHRVVALVRPPQSSFELGCAAQVFGIERPGLPTRYGFRVCTERPGPVATHAGYDMLVTTGLEALDEADTVIVPGWLPAQEPPSPTVVQALRRAHSRGARVASICSGAFALAHAGLLDGRAATTHWALADEFAARFPHVKVDPDVLYVDHGDVATNAGAGAASTCACTCSATTRAPGTPPTSPGPWSCRPTARAASSSTRHRRTPSRSTAPSPPSWSGSPGGSANR